MSENSNNKLDHVLIRVKDVLLIGGAVLAMGAWVIGLAGLPDKVETNRVRITMLEARQASSDIIAAGMQKDLNYLTSGVDEIKTILREVYKREQQRA